MLSKTEPTRLPHSYCEHPCPEAIWATGNLDGKGLLSIVADGKSQYFSLNRRQMFSLAEQIFGAIKKMEPGK